MTIVVGSLRRCWVKSSNSDYETMLFWFCLFGTLYLSKDVGRFKLNWDLSVVAICVLVARAAECEGLLLYKGGYPQHKKLLFMKLVWSSAINI